MTKNEHIAEIRANHVFLGMTNPENFPLEQFEMLNLANPDWYIEFMMELNANCHEIGVRSYAREASELFSLRKPKQQAIQLAKTVMAATIYEEQRAKDASTEILENVDCSIFE